VLSEWSGGVGMGGEGGAFIFASGALPFTNGVRNPLLTWSSFGDDGAN